MSKMLDIRAAFMAEAERLGFDENESLAAACTIAAEIAVLNDMRDAARSALEVGMGEFENQLGLTGAKPSQESN